MPQAEYNQVLHKQAANHVPLSPLSFLERSAQVYPQKTAIINSERRISYHSFYERSRRLASALKQHGLATGDSVAVLAPNTPALLEAHYGVPMCRAVLCALNTRLDSNTIAFILKHSEAKVLIADIEFADTVQQALAQLENAPLLIGISDNLSDTTRTLGEMDYEDLLASGDADYSWQLPDDEWDAISLNYTSGTTGQPKGVVYHHRGAYLGAMGNCLQFRLRDDSKYLWTLPMFHCNGWMFTWAVTAAGGTHVCLRKVEPQKVFSLIAEHDVTHMCGAPIVLNMLINSPDSDKTEFSQVVDVATGGAAPPSKIISEMEQMGFNLTHLYGLTESFGPSTICSWQDKWSKLDLEQKSQKMARQGVRMPMVAGQMVCDDAMQSVPGDGKIIGELMLRGNTIMKGYFKNPQATAEAFAGGWFHTGDLAVQHSDGYVEIKDRTKDIIISGGENISSLEVEETLYKHPAILEAAVVAQPDEHWGETPCAFITLKDSVGEVTAEQVIAFCKEHMARYKAPKNIVFQVLPKTSTGKIQKHLLRRQVKELLQNR
jgi:fatty-acyl-CoA synthase